MSINFGQFPLPRLPLDPNDKVVGYQLIGSVPTLAQYTLTDVFNGVFPGGVLPIANGGTGATTAPQALTNLGAASLLTNTFAGNQTISVSNATLNIDAIGGGNSANILFERLGVSQWEIRSVSSNALFLDRFVGGAFVNSPISVDQASGTVNLPLVSATGGAINGTTVGAATPSSGAFTTVTATGTITPSQTAGIVGTTTNNNANAGSVGQFVSSTVLVGSAIPLTSTVTANITSISLTAGDWDVWATVATNPAAGTITQQINFWTSTASATVPIAPNNGAQFFENGMTAANQIFVLPVGQQRISIAATTSVFLSVACTFSVSTLSAYGFIGARRVR